MLRPSAQPARIPGAACGMQPQGAALQAPLHGLQRPKRTQLTLGAFASRRELLMPLESMRGSTSCCNAPEYIVARVCAGSRAPHAGAPSAALCGSVTAPPRPDAHCPLHCRSCQVHPRSCHAGLQASGVRCWAGLTPGHCRRQRSARAAARLAFRQGRRGAALGSGGVLAQARAAPWSCCRRSRSRTLHNNLIIPLLYRDHPIAAIPQRAAFRWLSLPAHPAGHSSPRSPQTATSVP